MLPKNLRLKNTKEIKNVFTKGKSTRCGFLFLKYFPNSLEVSRFAISVGLSYSKSAVKRNALKRKIRAAIRENVEKLQGGFDGVFFVRGVTPENISFEEIEKNVAICLEKADLLKNK